ncbi:MAG: hypothetical protein KDD22_03695 [Bdellovibrionales bacterium]|nr:hypothetical protein [Bdellovibrionales bacterium]
MTVGPYGTLCISARTNGKEAFGHTQVQYLAPPRRNGFSELILMESPQGITVGAEGEERWMKYLHYMMHQSFAVLCLDLNARQEGRLKEYLGGRRNFSFGSLDKLEMSYFNIFRNNCTDSGVSMFKEVLGPIYDHQGQNLTEQIQGKNLSGMSSPTVLHDVIAFRRLRFPRPLQAKVFRDRESFYEYICPQLASVKHECTAEGFHDYDIKFKVDRVGTF